ncbi:phosphoketolase [Candidatus Nomurabacteria bacterium RIFCSPLOWO2_02_FULL_40_10]|uniref:Probable phosphoketolase n=2 Tax=Candidatus Nomuraibacteriota TaxID=1752729 RepID=A0A1F6Y0M4_9BACT|nr:MAG: phosphoketolase [Candidatus Nomurabacteria bacterium RIFCSPHIGHO2_01_FULL_39_10]OGI99913.1 MAG: phosphoketolase [Candidatus Nomurabacteria bacterium RIFCSPLOWO2_02_FULL_40_10]
MKKNNYLSKDIVAKINAYWRAANYLSIGQIYLYDNPLGKCPLSQNDIKPLLMGHWGTSPGQNFIYVHLNRIIKKYDLDMFYISGPGHGGPSLLANTYLEGTYSEVYPEISQNEKGMKKLFTQFSFPGGVPSHVSPECPGSIHEGGELGYSLSHAFGAVFDNPDLITACVVGDGEAETGPLATSWHSNKFLNPKTDGAVLPIFHLNGYKISNPTIFARISKEELDQLFRGYGWTPHIIEGEDPEIMHQAMAKKLDEVVVEIKRIQADARERNVTTRPRWPMIVLITPKGWTGPKIIDGKPNEGTFRSHQVIFADLKTNKTHFAEFTKWLKSYKPEELFDSAGRLKPELAELAPKGNRRMGANPHTNGGLLLRKLHVLDFKKYAVEIKKRGEEGEGAMRVFAQFLRDIIKANKKEQNFRLFGPDETMSNGLGAVFEVTNRQMMTNQPGEDEFTSPSGRVMEVLSEHTCQGWLEGYLLTGRHGLFNSYEAFINIVSSMFNQHAKWLNVVTRIPWRKKIASLNYLISSHVWRQGHNGFTHQDPGFIDHVYQKKADIIQVYLPPDANCLLAVMDRCMKSMHQINVVIAGKHTMPQWFSIDEAIRHTFKGIGVLDWASNDKDGDPDAVIACAGDVPTLEVLAAVSIMREHIPKLKLRVINVLDLMTLRPHKNHPHGIDDTEFEALFTKDKPITFIFHGYSSLIHRLTYSRPNHNNMHVYGYKEEGTTTTPFDMTVLNAIDRYHIVEYVINSLPNKGNKKGDKETRLLKLMEEKLDEHRRHVVVHGNDMPEVRNWRWTNYF